MTEAADHRQAEKAFKAAGLPLPSDFESDEDLQRASKQFGVEGLSAPHVLGPIWQDLPLPRISPGISREEAEEWYKSRAWSIGASAMASVLAKSWRDDYRIHRIMEGLLGKRGPELYANVLAELLYLSFFGRFADRACLAVRLYMERPGRRPAVAVAMWDAGAPFVTPEQLLAFWQLDGLRLSYDRPNWPENIRLFKETRPLLSKWLVPASVVLPAIQRFAGGLTAISGANRLDITVHDGVSQIRQRKVRPIVGNVVLATMPHVQSGAARAAPRQRSVPRSESARKSAII